MNVGADSVDMTGSGAFDYRNARGEATYRMQLPMFGEVGMDMRMVGTKVFVHLPETFAGAGLTGGKKWASVDLAKSLEQAGLGGLDFTQQQDPAQMLQYLRAASTGVEEAGTATVRGVETTRYSGRMDFPQGTRRRHRRARALAGRAAAGPPGHGGDARPARREERAVRGLRRR